MSYYQRAISEDTGETDPRALAAIEEHMRSDIVHSTLDWLSKRQFKSAARKAYQLYVALHAEATDEQIARAFRITAVQVPAYREELTKARASL